MLWHLAPSSIALRVNLKLSMFGTRCKISSVTLQLLRPLTHLISKFLSRLSSLKSKSSGIVCSANLANKISISIPSKHSLITGTNASSTALKSFTSSYNFNLSQNEVKKKSLQSTCLCNTQCISISTFCMCS